MIVNKNIDVLCVSETWLEPNVPDDYVNINGYNLFRSDGGRGGGTCIYARNDLRRVRMKNTIPLCEGIEDVWVKLQLRKLPTIIVGSLYRHPNTPVNTFDYIHNVLQAVSMENKKFFLLGDLNDDQLQSRSKVKNIVNLLNCSQVIDKPTRITPHS